LGPREETTEVGGGVHVVFGRKRLLQCIVAGLTVVLALPAGHLAHASSSPGMAFGFNNLLSYAGWYTADDVGRAMSDVQPGAVLRFPVGWADVQSTCSPSSVRSGCVTPAPIDWSNYDSRLTVLAKYNVRFLPVVIGAPVWARGTTDVQRSGLPPVMPPGDDSWALGYWQNFVTALVRHFQTLFGSAFSQRLAGVEVWNEENGVVYWTTTVGPDPARYSRLLCAAYRGVRAADSSLPVIFGGISYQASSQAGSVLTIPDFLNGAYGTAPSTDMRGCMTELGLHPYGAAASETISPTDPSSSFQLGLGQMRQAATAHADAGRHLAITEFGYYVGPITAQQQSDWDVQSYNLASSMSDVDMEIVNGLFDTPAPSGAVNDWGGCSAPGATNARPVASALKDLLRSTSAPAGC
jgi:hypothetical protein